MTDWHIDRWPPLAWVETGIKGIAILLAVVAFARGADPAASLSPRVAAMGAILGILSLGLVAAIADRIRNREVIAMGFVLFNNLGHAAATATLFLARSMPPLLVAFAACMLLGDLVKILFIQRSGFRVRNASPATLILLTLVYVVGYAAVLTLAVT